MDNQPPTSQPASPPGQVVSPNGAVQPNTNTMPTPTVVNPVAPAVNTQSVYPAATPSVPSYQNVNYQGRAGMFSGRLNRMGFFMAGVYIALYFFITLMLLFVGGKKAGAMNIFRLVDLLLMLIGVVVLIPVAFGVGIRRWHDMDKSGFFVLLGFIPLVGILCWLIQLFAPGSSSSNNYGDPDDRGPSFKKVLFGK